MPLMIESIGSRKRLAVTKQLTGLPGSASMRVLPILPKVVGLPGFMLSLPKKTVP